MKWGCALESPDDKDFPLRRALLTCFPMIAHLPSPDAMQRTSPAIPKFGEWSWILTLFGTAVGAGILYLPLQVGPWGLWSLAFLSTIVFPLIYFSHKSVVSLLLLDNDPLDYTGVVSRHFGPKFGLWVSIAFLLTFYAVLFSYSIGLNANLGAFLFQMDATSSNWAHGPFLSLIVLAAFAALHALGDKIVLRLMSALSSLLLVVLLGISLYLVPFWNLSLFRQIPTPAEFLDDVLLILPLFAFSFVFFPAMSSMAAAYRGSRDYDPNDAHRRLNRAVLKTSALLLAFVLFFVLSCILSLEPSEFERAAAENLNCLSLLSTKASIPDSMAHLSALVGLCALVTSFAGVFFAVRDAAHGLACRALARLAPIHPPSRRLLARIWLVDAAIMAALFSSLWILTLANPSVMDLFGLLISPLVAMFLFIIPVAILVKTNGIKVLKNPSLSFVFAIGILLLFSFKLGTWIEKFL